MTADTSPALFDLSEVEAGILDAVTRQPGQCSGARIDRQVELVTMVLDRLAAGCSQREVARLTGLHRRTVAGILARAEQCGRIAPHKQAVSQLLGRAIRGGVELWIERMEAGEVPASTIPVAVGIFSDKKAMLDGEATSRVEHRREIGREDVEGYLRRLPSAASSSASGAGLDLGPVAPATIDSQSVENTTKSQ